MLKIGGITSVVGSTWYIL